MLHGIAIFILPALLFAALRLSVRKVKDHDISNLTSHIPLVIIDCWEHAYYLDYAFRKKDYFVSFMDLINWDVAEARFVSI